MIMSLFDADEDEDEEEAAAPVLNMDDKMPLLLAVGDDDSSVVGDGGLS